MKTAAIDAVAEHYSATRNEDASALTIAGKRVLIDVATIKRRKTGSEAGAKPRLRFDKVAIELVDGLRSALKSAVPDGKTLVLTVTAPIRQSGRTTAAFEERIRNGLALRRARLDIKARIEGNQVRARLVKARCAAKVIGFVHNPNIDGTVLLDATQAFLAALEAANRKRARSKARGERWLAVVGEDGFVGMYRHICETSDIAAGFKKVLIVLGDGSVC